MNVIRMVRRGVFSVALVGMVAGPAVGHVIKPQPRVRVTGTVLLGTTVGFRGLAVVDRKEVFQSIPAWQTIVREKVGRKTARYHFLLKEANDAFRRALEQVAVDNEVDLVVDAGGVEAQGLQVLDLTTQMKTTVSSSPGKRTRR